MKRLIALSLALIFLAGFSPAFSPSFSPARSLATGQAESAAVAAPTNTVAPVASGTARVGQTLSCTDGTWTGSPTFTYQWRRDGSNIGSATASTYVLTVTDIGTAVDCNVTGTNAGGSASADSNNITLENSLAAVTANAVFHLDATISASYGGSGQEWDNIVTAPADSSAQTAYDFYLGATSGSEASDPAFSGSAGSQSAYWDITSGDHWILKSGSNPALWRDAHKSSGGTDWTVIIAWRSPTADVTADGLFTTQSASAGQGFRIQQTASETFNMTQRGNSTTSVSTHSATLAGATDHITIVSRRASDSTVRIWIDSTTAENFTQTFDTTTTNATNAIVLGLLFGDGSFPLNTGARVYAYATMNALLDNTLAATIISAFESKWHNRDYTP